MPKTDEVNQFRNVVVLISSSSSTAEGLTAQHREMLEVIRRRGGAIDQDELLRIVDSPFCLETLKRLAFVTVLPFDNYHRPGKGTAVVGDKCNA